MATQHCVASLPPIPSSGPLPNTRTTSLVNVQATESSSTAAKALVTQQCRHSIASDLSCNTLDSGSSSSSSNSMTNSIGFPGASRPSSATTFATSRPSSVASNASSGSQGHSQAYGHLAACPALLSPGLASALGLGPSTGSGSASSARGEKKVYGRTRAQSSQGALATGRRPSLPIVPSMANRISVASISSFDSLPEDEMVLGFGAMGLAGSASSSSSDKRRGSSMDRSRNSPQLGADSPRLEQQTLHSELSTKAFPSMTESPKSSPVGPDADADSFAMPPPEHSREGSKNSFASAASTSSSRPPVALRRSATEPVKGKSTTSKAQQEMMVRRKLIANELLETERLFVASLKLVDQSYYQPLLSRVGKSGSANSGGQIISRKVLGEIFSNFADIYQLNSELLSRLEERLSGKSRASFNSRPLSMVEGERPSGQVAGLDGTSKPWDPALDNLGDILLPLAPFLKMYSLFVKNFTSSLERIESERKSNESFARFLTETEKARWGREKSTAAGASPAKPGFGFGLGFQAHLLTIVQRIPRYKLLINDLVKSTPETHPDWKDLNRTEQMIEQVASYINENIRQHEMIMTMLSLQRSIQGLTEPLIAPGRSFIKRGTLIKTCRRNFQPREFFLFSDCLIYASPITGGIESASAAWLAFSRSGLYPAGLGESIYGGPPQSPTSSNGDASPIESSYHRMRTFSVPEPYTPLAGAIFNLSGQQLQFRSKFMLRDCTVVGVDDISVDGLRHCFEIRTPDKSFAVYAETSAAKEAWLSAIRDAKTDFMSARRTLKAEEDSIEAKRDRRRSQYRVDPSRPGYRKLAGQAGPSIYLGAGGGMSHSPSTHTITETEGEGADARESETVLHARPDSAAPKDSSRPISFPSSSTSVSLVTLLAPSANATPTRPLKVLEDYNAPVWVPDSRADKCVCCSESFGMWRRKHHCRLCGRVVCWSCSTRSFLIPSYEEGEEDKPARACDSCYDSVFPAESPEMSPAQFGSRDDGLQGRRDSSVDRDRNRFPDSDTSPGSPDTPGEGSPPTIPARVLPNGSSSSSNCHLRPFPTSAKLPVRPTSLRIECDENVTEGGLERKVADEAPRFTFGEARSRTSISLAPGTRFPGDRALAAEARLFNASLSPQVQAATSGTGTFRLVTPRLTTPEAEEPVRRMRKDSTQSVVGSGGSYFADADSVDHSANDPRTNDANVCQSAAQISSGTHLRQQLRKKPLSAAARLSSFYGAGLGLNPSKSDLSKK
ncbi:hypothetical protein IE53DRAFT_368539 [Violaceomyces palustris]|uniref:Uncharacterized protein n=1 Tax=Violaceomyces palustris TaxID=1673888 RepID=A0ACD0NYF3_9BASI|nr:hypothetical protein IE53DRAFT_368539 [Violaceomyces palustris]